MMHALGVIVIAIAGAYLLVLLVAALKGFTLRETLWILGDAWRDPMKWLRPRDEQGRLRPTVRGTATDTCDRCGKVLRGPRSAITYSHVVGPDGKPLSDEPLPESRHFCSKECLDEYDRTAPQDPLPEDMTLTSRAKVVVTDDDRAVVRACQQYLESVPGCRAGWDEVRGPAFIAGWKAARLS